MLNGLKHVKRMVTNAWGLDHHDPEYEYSHVLDADVNNLVAAMKEALGRSPREVERNGHQNTNPFNTNARASRMPWTKVADGTQDLDEYVRRFCTMRAG